MNYKNDDVRIADIRELLPPIALLEKFPATNSIADLVFNARDKIHQILEHKDDRLLVVIGPCSIHDTKAALEYANRLKNVRTQYQNELEIVMRVYFEKPRTTVGWKGLINDPFINHTFDINEGLKIARKLLVDIYRLDLLCFVASANTFKRATESFHPIHPSVMLCPYIKGWLFSGFWAPSCRWLSIITPIIALSPLAI